MNRGRIDMAAIVIRSFVPLLITGKREQVLSTIIIFAFGS